MPPKSDYQCVDCAFYDQLEIYAMHRKTLIIRYITVDGIVQTSTTQIKDLQTRNKAEFIITSTAEWIRLDRIEKIEEL